METQNGPEKSRQTPSVELAAELDSQGWLAAPGEDLTAYAERLEQEQRKIKDFNEQLDREKVLEPYTGLVVDASSRIPQEILAEAAETTRAAYGFDIRWVPGFFPVHGLGLLWGGCSISSDEDIPALFIIRRSFAKNKRWFIYSRSELTSHELCHVARTPLNDMEYEEHFAYAISGSPLRRYSGNCFKSEKDALLFLLPVFLLLAVQLLRVSLWPMIPAWILIFIWPVWLLILNAASRKRYFRAENALKSYTDRPGAVLFRCTAAEINRLAEIADQPEEVRNFLNEKKDSDLRWQIIYHRFMNKKEDTNG